MPKILYKIEIEDFRSFDKEIIDFEDVTCIVGPNEGGKTNLLDALNMLVVGNMDDPSDKNVMRISDIRKNSPRFREEKLPSLRFELNDRLIQNKQLRKIFQIRKESIIILRRDGNNISVDMEPQIAKQSIILRNLTEDIIEIKKEEARKHLEIEPLDWIMIDRKTYDALKSEVEPLISTGKIELVEEMKIGEVLKDILKTELKENLNVFFWGYDKEKYGIPDMINIQEFINNPDNRLAVLSIFRLAGYDKEEIPNLFKNKSETDYENIFDEISKKVTEEIRKAWPPNPHIEIKITYKTDHLLINIKEPGYSIEPKYRSEGLQWFLAFLVGILAQSKDIKDHIILIDEPALYLHPGGQKAVLTLINKLAINNQVIYSTHSPFMIDKRFPERVRFLIKDTQTGYSLTKVEKPTKSNILRDPLLREALGYTVTDLSYLSEKNVLVEGYFDKKVIEILVGEFIKIGKMENTLDLNNTSLIDCSGAGEISKHAKLYKEAGLICISIYDSDKSGKSAMEANIKNNIQSKEEIITISDVEIKAKTLEDLLPEVVFEESIKEYFKIKKEDKIKAINKAPRSNGINSLINQRIKSKNVSIEEQKEIRRKIKREFEECMIEKLKEFINKNGFNKSLNHLLKLHNLIRDRIKEKQEKNT